VFIVKDAANNTVYRSPFLSDCAKEALARQNASGVLHTVDRCEHSTHVAGGFGPIAIVGAMADAVMSTFGGA
jgi:hypothetical protein